MKTPHVSSDDLALLAVTGDPEPPHLAECSRCREELEQLRSLVGELRSLPEPPDRLLEAAKSYYRKRRRLEDLVERLAGDPALRKELAAKPQAVLRRAGLEPTPELIEALRDVERAPGAVADRIAAKLLW